MTKKVLALALAGLVATGLVACGSDYNTDTDTSLPGADVGSIDYFGHPLNCVQWNGSHSEHGRTCDFEEYHHLYGYPNSTESR